jgi:uncharacterized membrane protein YhaH (DUF805 family)
VALVLFLPYIAVLARRLHDINLSGWWMASFLPVLVIAVFMPMLSISEGFRIGIFLLYGWTVVFVICMSLPGTKGENRFGQNPLGPSI